MKVVFHKIFFLGRENMHCTCFHKNYFSGLWWIVCLFNFRDMGLSTLVFSTFFFVCERQNKVPKKTFFKHFCINVQSTFLLNESENNLMVSQKLSAIFILLLASSSSIPVAAGLEISKRGSYRLRFLQ